MFIYKSKIEERLNQLKREIEDFTIESEQDSAYISIKTGMYIELCDFYNANYSNTNPDFIIFYKELLTLYIELRKEVYNNK